MSSKASVGYDYQCGEDVTLGLEASPAFDGTETITCKMKAAVHGVHVPENPTAPLVATFAAQFQDDTSTTPARWHLSLSASQTAALASGDYVADTRIAYGDGEVVISEPVRLTFHTSVSGEVTS